MTDQQTQSQTSASANPAAGWYPDPQGQGLRWWDGSAWTEHTHDQAADNGSAAASTSSATAAAPASGGSSAITTASGGKPVKGDDKTRVSFVNDHAVAILIVLAAILAVVFVLQFA